MNFNMCRPHSFYEYSEKNVNSTSNTTSSTNSPVTRHDNTEDPVTSKWNSWAKEEDKYQKCTTTKSVKGPRSPKISHSPKIPSMKYKKPNYYRPTEEQMTLMTADPPVCFCKKPAHRSYTLEYGPILECATYGTKLDLTKNDKLTLLRNKYTCGFHVHETSWIQLRKGFLNGDHVNEEYPELRTCSLYNLTYCVMFHVTNSYNKAPPFVLPNCFCGKPVVLRIISNVHTEHRPRYIFACPTGNTDHVKRCSWKLEAHEVAFPRPRNNLHTYVDKEVYEDQTVDRRKPLVMEDPKPNKTHHRSELLATLAGFTPSSAPPLATSSSGKTINKDDVIEFDALKDKLSSSLLIPTSVLSKKQPSPSVSSSTTTTTASFSVINSPTSRSEVEELRFQLHKAKKVDEQRRRENEQQKKLVEYQRREMESIQDKQLQIEIACKEEVYNMSLDLEQECLLRQNCQLKLSQLEIDVVHLIDKNERTEEQFAIFRESIKLKYGKEEEHNKCKVCFHRSIEYVLIPCFHLAYCQACAYKLKECAICRRLITGVQKVFNP